MEIIRQGDVFLELIEKLPKGLTKVEPEKAGDDRIILQHSETSGNHHHFQGNAAVDMYQELDSPLNSKTITPDYGKFIVVKEGTNLFHGKGFVKNPTVGRTGDHHALYIHPGVYRIGITPEISDEEDIMPVID